MHHFKPALKLAILISSLSAQGMELVSSLSQSFLSGFSQKLREQGPKDIERLIVSSPIGTMYMLGKTAYAFSSLAYYYEMHSVRKWSQENHVDEKIFNAVLEKNLQEQELTEKTLQPEPSDSDYADDIHEFLDYLGHKNPSIVPIQKMTRENYENFDNSAGCTNGKRILIDDNYAATNPGNGLFTCAHETAHYALRHVYYTRDTKEYEKEADLVAAYILCGLGLESAVEDRISLIDSLSDAAKDSDDGKHPTRREEFKYLTKFLNADEDKRISMIYNNMSKEQKQTLLLRLASKDRIAFCMLYLTDKYIVQSCIVQSWELAIEQMRKYYYEKTNVKF